MYSWKSTEESACDPPLITFIIGTGKVENLAAGGFGSTTTLKQQTVSGSSNYVAKQVKLDNEWHVVMSRPYKASDEYDVNFERDTVPMAFAVWQGNEKERDGNKRITHTWINLDARLDSQ